MYMFVMFALIMVARSVWHKQPNWRSVLKHFPLLGVSFLLPKIGNLVLWHKMSMRMSKKKMSNVSAVHLCEETTHFPTVAILLRATCLLLIYTCFLDKTTCKTICCLLPKINQSRRIWISHFSIFFSWLPIVWEILIHVSLIERMTTLCMLPYTVHGELRLVPVLYLICQVFCTEWAIIELKNGCKQQHTQLWEPSPREARASCWWLGQIFLKDRTLFKFTHLTELLQNEIKTFCILTGDTPTSDKPTGTQTKPAY